MFDAATSQGYKKLHLQIISEDPRVLSWPWEALRDPEANYLSHACQIERRLDKVRDPRPLSLDLPDDCINILLVTARPFKNDVQYRSISRLLVELIEERDLPARVHVLRPPTFDNLLDHLEITSRSEENWLGVDRRKVGISGLSGEERWLYLEEILGAMGAAINREDPDLVRLMDLLNGHPLSMRVILPMLEKQNAASVTEALQSGMSAIVTCYNEPNARLYSALGFAQTALAEDLQPLLIPLGMHERFVALGFLGAMARQVDES